MNIKFMNDIQTNYMVIEDVQGFSEDDYGMKIFADNDIKGMIDFDYEILNGKTSMLYDITSKQCFSNKYDNGKMSFNELKFLIFSLKSVIRNLNSYLLDVDNVILKKECIFIDERSGRYEYCYYPFYNGNLILEIRELFSEILSLIDYNDQKAVRLAYDIQKLSQRNNFTLEDITNIAGKITIEKIDFEKNDEEENDKVSGETHNYEGRNRKVKEGRKEESFMKKAGAYFKETDGKEIFDDINNLKIFKKIKEQGGADAEKEKKGTQKAEKAELKKAKREWKNVKDDSSFNDDIPDELLELQNSFYEDVGYVDNRYTNGF